MTEPTVADYSMLEQNITQLHAQVRLSVEQLRDALALGEGSENHKLEVMVGLLVQLKAGDPVTLAGLLTAALTQLTDCTGRHLVEVDEPSVEDW